MVYLHLVCSQRVQPIKRLKFGDRAIVCSRRLLIEKVERIHHNLYILRLHLPSATPISLRWVAAFKEQQAPLPLKLLPRLVQTIHCHVYHLQIFIEQSQTKAAYIQPMELHNHTFSSTRHSQVINDGYGTVPFLQILPISSLEAVTTPPGCGI
jgi:hypothetical protein